MNTVKSIKRTIVILIILFVILSTFDCVEITSTIARNSGIDKFLPITFGIAIVHLVAILMNNEVANNIGVWISIVGAVFSLRIPFFSIYGSEIFDMIGEKNNYVTTFFGYAVVIVSFTLVIMQIILYHLTKKR